MNEQIIFNYLYNLVKLWKNILPFLLFCSFFRLNTFCLISNTSVVDRIVRSEIYIEITKLDRRFF